MSDLVLRPYDKARWCLQLRRAGLPETEYITLSIGDETWAREIVGAGAPFWLFGEPRDSRLDDDVRRGGPEYFRAALEESRREGAEAVRKAIKEAIRSCPSLDDVCTKAAVLKAIEAIDAG